MSNLSVAGRVGLFAALYALIVACGAAALIVYHEYGVALDRVLARGNTLVTPLETAALRPDRDEILSVAAILPRIAELPAVRYAALLDPEGGVIRSLTVPGAPPYATLPLATLRGKASAISPAIRRREAQDGTTRIEITLPVFGYRKSLAGAAPGVTVSQLLVAYVHIGVEHAALLAGIRPFAQRVCAGALGFALLAGLIAFLITRRETAPLTRLEQMVDDVANGLLDRSLSLRNTAEVNRVVSMINVLMSEVNRHKVQFETDNKLLTLQVDQRNRELQQRNEELNEAVHKLTQSKHKLYELAFYDNLTSLPNRRLFLEEMQFLLQLGIRQKTRIALLFVDLDNFKRINDSLGHRIGDLLLREVGARLRRCLRSSDLAGKYVLPETKIDVSRLGGDEFTVVLNNLETAEEAGPVAQRLVEVLRAPMLIEGHELIVTPSIGIAIAPDDAVERDELLKLADTAMYHAKAAGRNGICFFRREMLKSSVGRLKLEADLRRGLTRGELVLHYQPQICANTGRILGAEALVRWQNPERGLVPPADFIPLAEEMGLIVEIGAWTLLEACRNIAALSSAGIHLPKLSVNVSSLQFNSDFTDLVRRTLREYGFNPGLLELELTEGVIMSNAKSAIEALFELKSLGVSLSVDDFGTGYSSLSYLSQFPLDELKIDRSFIVNSVSDRRAQELVRAIIAMGKSLKLRLVAEGVDSVDQFRFLREASVDLIQGHLFSKAVPMEELLSMLDNNPFTDQMPLISGLRRPHR